MIPLIPKSTATNKQQSTREAIGLADGFHRDTQPDERDGLGRYCAEALNHDALDAQEELRLGRAISAGRKGGEIVGEQAKSAFQRLTACNLRLVCHVVTKEFSVDRALREELIAAGNLGLAIAAQRYDAGFGTRFSTYAYMHIRSKVFAALNQERRTVHLPRNIHESLAKLRTARGQLTQSLGRPPEQEELAAELRWPTEKVVQHLCHEQYPASLDAPVGEDDGATFGQTLADDSAETPAEAAGRSSDIERVRRALDELPPRDADVLRMREGIGGPEMTLEQIGGRLGVTRERARQVEQRARRRLMELMS
ncbi:MAG: sigma-70 family RNA polymerase sigma factor [Opitutales bacterium]